jgi:hypothetical protein
VDLGVMPSGSEGGPRAFKRFADLNIVRGNYKGAMGLSYIFFIDEQGG